MQFVRGYRREPFAFDSEAILRSRHTRAAACTKQKEDGRTVPLSELCLNVLCGRLRREYLLRAFQRCVDMGAEVFLADLGGESVLVHDAAGLLVDM